MFCIPGQRGKDVCDKQLGMTRRDILRVGGAGAMGLSLGQMLQHEALANANPVGGPGWGKIEGQDRAQAGQAQAGCSDARLSRDDSMREMRKTRMSLTVAIPLVLSSNTQSHNIT